MTSDSSIPIPHIDHFRERVLAAQARIVDRAPAQFPVPDRGRPRVTLAERLCWLLHPHGTPDWEDTRPAVHD